MPVVRASCLGKEQTRMSEGDGRPPADRGSPSSSSSETPPSVATIVDSTVKVLPPQLTDKIEQQVSQAIKTAFAAISTAGQQGCM